MSEAKKDINMIAMEVIMNAGDGREKVDEALAAIAGEDLERAEVVQSQVSGEDMEYSLLFVHAQDTVMTITSELRMAQRLLPIVKMLLEKTKGE